MTSSWQIKDGQIACRWSDLTEGVKSNLSWMQASPDIQGSHLPPLPDFANHSPFGGPYSFWFMPEHQRDPGQ